MTLEQALDELVQRATAKGYTPTTFLRMRSDHRSVEAVRRLVETSVPQSGFHRLKAVGPIDWSLEAVALRYPTHFTRLTVAHARAGLQGLFDA